jgi:hypothetical protein
MPPPSSFPGKKNKVCILCFVYLIITNIWYTSIYYKGTHIHHSSFLYEILNSYFPLYVIRERLGKLWRGTDSRKKHKQKTQTCHQKIKVKRLDFSQSLRGFNQIHAQWRLRTYDLSPNQRMSVQKEKCPNNGKNAPMGQELEKQRVSDLNEKRASNAKTL